MDRKISLLKFFSQVFTLYGITTVLLNIFCIVFGEPAYGLSTIFSLGSAGVGTATSFQFLLALLIINALRVVVTTDILIKKMPTAVRIIALYAGAVAVTLAFIFIFDWFPTDMPFVWGMFAICFIISCAVSTLISVIAQRQENRRLEEALKRCKREEQYGDDDICR